MTVDESTEVGSPTKLANRDDLTTELLELAPLIFRVAMSIVRNRTMAEDVVQDTLMKAWSHLEGYRGDASFRVWVLRIANNTAISALRKSHDHPTDPTVFAEVHTATAGPDRRAEGREMVGELWQALELLDPLSRAVLVLRELEGMPYEDIAQVLDVALPTVKTRLFRARRELATRLDGWR